MFRDNSSFVKYGFFGSLIALVGLLVIFIYGYLGFKKQNQEIAQLRAEITEMARASIAATSSRDRAQQSSEESLGVDTAAQETEPQELLFDPEAEIVLDEKGRTKEQVAAQAELNKSEQAAYVGQLSKINEKLIKLDADI